MAADEGSNILTVVDTDGELMPYVRLAKVRLGGKKESKKVPQTVRTLANYEAGK